MGEEDRATTLLKLGGMAALARRPDEAFSYWQRIATDFKGTSSWPAAMFNMGMAHQAKAAQAQAIAVFEELRDSQVNDREPGRGIMETWRNYRPLAQWEIGNSLLRQGNYAGALAAYRLMREKFPFQSWCGNAIADWEYRYALQEGLVLEHLKRYDEAVNAYLRATAVGLSADPRASLRLVNLYGTAGQWEDLIAILDQWDRRFSEKLGNHPIAEEYRPTHRMRRLAQLHQLERARDWLSLVALLRIRHSTSGPEEARERLTNYEAVEAARLLSRHPAEVVPLLEQRVAELKAPTNQRAADAKWVFYALGLCGTPEAVAILQRHTTAESNLWELRTLIYSLSIAGEAGQTALQELAQNPRRGNFQSVMRSLAAGELGSDSQEIVFPPLPPGTKLPGPPQVTLAVPI
jgi:tetratricopeptide (TPR) repeat protein